MREISALQNNGVISMVTNGFSPTFASHILLDFLVTKWNWKYMFFCSSSDLDDIESPQFDFQLHWLIRFAEWRMNAACYKCEHSIDDILSPRRLVCYAREQWMNASRESSTVSNILFNIFHFHKFTSACNNNLISVTHRDTARQRQSINTHTYNGAYGEYLYYK